MESAELEPTALADPELMLDWSCNVFASASASRHERNADFIGENDDFMGCFREIHRTCPYYIDIS